MCTDASRLAQRKYNASPQGKETRRKWQEKKAEKAERYTSDVLNSPLARGLSEAERGDFYFFEPGTFSGEMIDNALKVNSSSERIKEIESKVKAENILINVNFPELTGTEKQINYAKSLIKKRLSDEINSVTSKLPKNLNDRATAKQNFTNSAKKMNADIDSFSGALNYALKNSKKGVLSFISNNQSAADIIDKYKLK